MTVKPMILSDDNFADEVLKASQPVVVDFWAPWCGPCRLVNPIVDALATEYEGRAKVGKVSIETEEGEALASAHGISAVPSLVFFQNGREVDRVVGVAATKEALTERLDAVLAGESADPSVVA